jgi:hypothetical protein
VYGTQNPLYFNEFAKFLEIVLELFRLGGMDELDVGAEGVFGSAGKPRLGGGEALLGKARGFGRRGRRRCRAGAGTARGAAGAGRAGAGGHSRARAKPTTPPQRRRSKPRHGRAGFGRLKSMNSESLAAASTWRAVT